MMVFWQQKLVFLATPKTASTAIEAALGPLAELVILRPEALKHTNAERFARLLLPFLAEDSSQDFEVSALMRHPRDWLGSWYRDRHRDDIAPEKSTRGISFDEFVSAYCRDDRPAFADVSSQADFLITSGGAPVQHLFRYEELDAFVRFLEDRLNFEILLPHLNVSPKGDSHLSVQTEALLQKTCARDFALYDSICHI